MARYIILNVGSLGHYVINILSYLQENIRCGYSLEVLLRCAANEYTQFLWSYEKKKYQHVLVEVKSLN